MLRLRHRLEYWLVAGVRLVAGVLPEPVSRGLGSAIGLVFYLFDGAHRRLAIRQLQAAFPTRSSAECRAIARATFVHFGQLLVGLLRFSSLTPEQMRRRVEFEGAERMNAALEAGRGVILVTGHFGVWEIQGIAHPLGIAPMSVLARALDNPHLHALLALRAPVASAP